uniref:Uncharacterized protein n=1 Tax=Aegilops tauschii subsp. strangulata TaxID=200361 RepID=A0A453ILZ6_AEGTS
KTLVTGAPHTVNTCTSQNITLTPMIICYLLRNYIQKKKTEITLFRTEVFWIIYIRVYMLPLLLFSLLYRSEKIISVLYCNEPNLYPYCHCIIFY